MKKDLIKKEYLKKIKLYDNYNNQYYNENQSEILDSEFDKLHINLAIFGFKTVG